MTDMDPFERERILTTAAERYMDGTITRDEYRRVKSEHRTDYVAMARAVATARLAAERRRRWWWPW